MKPFGPTYKTYEGAQKRASFERAMNPGEYARGDATKLYSYSIVRQGEHWRVAREERAQ